MAKAIEKDVYINSFSNFTDGFIGSNMANNRFDLTLKNSPSVMMKEAENAFRIELVVPGFEHEDLEIEVNDEIIVVTIEKYLVTDASVDNYSGKEFYHKRFCHTIHLPENSLPEDLEVGFSNNIIELIIPKNQICF